MPDITRGPYGVARIAPVGPAGPPGTNGANGTNGSDGAPGLPGVNAVANDTATATYISTPSSATATALSASIDASSGARRPALQRIQKAVAGETFRVQVIGTSIASFDNASVRIICSWLKTLYGEAAVSQGSLGVLGGNYEDPFNGWKKQPYGGALFTRSVGDSTSGVLPVAAGYCDHVEVEFSRETNSTSVSVRVDGTIIGTTPAAGSQAYRQMVSVDLPLGWHVVTVDAPTSGKVYAETYRLVDTTRAAGVEVIDWTHGGTGFKDMTTLRTATTQQLAGVPIVGDNGYDYFFDRPDVDAFLVQHGTNDSQATLVAGAQHAVDKGYELGVPVVFVIEPGGINSTTQSYLDKRDFLLGLRRHPWVTVIDWHRALWPSDDFTSETAKAKFMDLYYPPGEEIHPDTRGYSVLTPLLAEAFGVSIPPFDSTNRSDFRRRYGVAPDLSVLSEKVTILGKTLDLPAPERVARDAVTGRSTQVHRVLLPLGAFGSVEPAWYASSTSDAYGKYVTSQEVQPTPAAIGDLFRVTAVLGFNSGAGNATIVVPNWGRVEDDTGVSLPQTVANNRTQVDLTTTPGEAPIAVTVLVRVVADPSSGPACTVSGQRIYEASTVPVSSPADPVVLDAATGTMSRFTALPVDFRRRPQAGIVEGKARRYETPAGTSFEMDSITDLYPSAYSSGVVVPYYRDTRAAQRARIDAGSGFNTDPNTYIAASGTASAFGKYVTNGGFQILGAAAGQEFHILLRANGVVQWQAQTNAALVVDGVVRSARVYNYLTPTDEPPTFGFRVQAIAAGDLQVNIAGRFYGLWATDSTVPLVTT